MWCSGPSSSWDLHEDGRPLLSEPPRHARCPFHPLSCGPETEQEEGTSINTLEASAYLADDATRELLLGSTCFLRPALPSFECATQRHGPPRRTCTGAPGPRHRIRPRGAARVSKYAWPMSSLTTNSAANLLAQYTAWPENVRWTCPSGWWLGWCTHCLSICPRTRRSTSARATACARKRDGLIIKMLGSRANQ